MDRPLKKPRFDPDTQRMLEELLTWEKKDALVWALDTAEHILPKFTAHHPEDPRPAECIRLGRQWLEGTVTFKEVRAAALAAHAAARAATEPSAIAAARACGHAIATIHVQTHAIGAALYGVKACLDDSEKQAERAWQWNHLNALRKEKTHAQ